MLPLPDDFPTQPIAIPLGDSAGHWLLTVVHQASNSTETAYAACYLVDAAWGQATLIGRSEPGGKVAGACAGVVGRDVTLVVSQADPGAPGASVEIRAYTFPDAVPPSIDPVAFAAFNRNGAIMRALTTENQRLAPLVGG